MINFFSHKLEHTSNLIFNYILYFGYEEFINRFNTNERINSLDITLGKSGICYKFTNEKGVEFQNEKNNCSFSRRHTILFKSVFFNQQLERMEDLSLVEMTKVSQLILLDVSQSKPSYGNAVKEIEDDKLLQLKAAIEFDISIPKTLITTQKQSVEKFNENHSEIIIKPISNHSDLKNENFLWHATGTRIFDEIDIQNLPDHFFPTLFQENINKLFEIRVFFFESKFWSMAIYSQRNEKTQIDFRNYDSENGNRCVPYKLTDSIEKKLLGLVKNLNYTTGSIDLIYTEKEEYIFLEINPSGQFGMVSIPCNFQIEKFIAQYLISHEEKKNKSF